MDFIKKLFNRIHNRHFRRAVLKKKSETLSLKQIIKMIFYFVLYGLLTYCFYFGCANYNPSIILGASFIGILILFIGQALR